MFKCRMNHRNFLVRLILLTLLLMTVITTYFYGTAILQTTPKSLTKPSLRRTTSSKPSAEHNCNITITKSDSKWFQEKHNSKINPFWTMDNMDIEAGVSTWWHSLQASKKTDLASTLKDLFNKGVPKRRQDITSQYKGNCTLCAVVGNSANLKDSNYGEVINKHDIVIRFNRGPTLGFENDVGSKTTHRILYPESATHMPPDTSLTLVPFKPLDVEWLLSAITTGTIGKTYMPVKRTIKCNVSRIAILHPEFIKHVHATWLDSKGRYPSTGAMGVGLALQICDKVNIFGFGADKNGGWQHYWEKLPDRTASAFRKTNVHSGDKQEEFLEKLASEGIANVYRGTGLQQ